MPHSNQGTFQFQEEILYYSKCDWDTWKCKTRHRLLKEETCVPDAVWNQECNHYGEYFTLNHYRKRGWHGYVWYAIGTWEPDNPKYAEGRAKVEELFRKKGLEKELEKLRNSMNSPRGAGEPDLFLYKKCDGEIRTKFIEVKKGGDPVSKAQRKWLAGIKKFLPADVGIVRVVEEGKCPKTRCYELDLVNFTGKIIKRIN